MKRASMFFLFVIMLSGCAITTFDTPQDNIVYKVVPVKYTRAERIRAGNVLFVNRSPVWRDILVYDGYKEEGELFESDDDGMPALSILPIGRFEVGPAEFDACDEDTNMNRRLVRFLSRGQEYTLIVVNKNIFGGLVPPFFTIFHGRVADFPAGERYYRMAWLGTMAGQYVWEIVNDVEYLPNVYVDRHYGTNYILNKTINVNLLIARAIRRLRSEHIQ